MSIQEKIEIFERYLEEGNGDINGQTIYEGKPIGQWAIQIRAQLKRKDKGLNLTEEQLERLEELGILERGIDSTIDEKIDALIEWKKKYPDVIIERKTLNQPISDITIKKLKELAQAEGIEFSELEERYKKIRSYNEYVRYRETNGKLTEAQWNKCKEGNLRGKFGFPTEIEQLADKLKIDVKKVADITDHFGSIENFIQMYRAGKLTREQTFMYNNNLINNVIDIDCNPLGEKYLTLVRAILGDAFYDKHEFMMFSSDRVKEALETLMPRDKEVMKLRFGLDDGKVKSLEDIAKYFNLTKERIRQIKAKSLTRLRHPSRSNKFKPFSIKDLKDNEYVSDEERKLLSNLEQDILDSNLIFKHDSIDELDFGKDKFDVVRNIMKKINKRAKEKTTQKVANKEVTDYMTIEELGFSVRTYHRLKQLGINTVKQLASISAEDLIKIRFIGERRIDEITSKLAKYGLKLGGIITTPEEEKKPKDMIDKNTIHIREIGLSTRAFNCLIRAEIETLADLEKLSYKELLSIKKLGDRTVLEIVDKAKEYGIIFDSEDRRESELEEIRKEKDKLEVELKTVDVKTKEAKKLLGKYERLIGDGKENTDDEAPDFKDE